MEKSVAWPAVAITGVFALLGGIVGGAIGAPQIDVPTADEIAAKVKLPEYKATPAYNDTALVQKVDKLSNEVLQEDLKEEKAKELVYDELKTKDFSRSLRTFLNNKLTAANSSSSIEDYKDVKSVVITDEEWTVSGDTASVEFDLKVGYFLDGDTDASDKEYAKVKVTLSVEDLDEDDLYVDAEVDSYNSSDFSLVKFYDN